MPSGRVPTPWRTRVTFVERDAGYITPCLESYGYTVKGYPRVCHEGKDWLVHRLVWTEAHGDPGDLHILHHCDNRRCGRLDHLFSGTNADNVRDREQKKRGGDHRGEAHGRAKLTDADIIAIRRTSSLTNRALATRYGVSASTIGRIRSRKRWGHV